MDHIMYVPDEVKPPERLEYETLTKDRNHALMKQDQLIKYM